MLQLGALDTHGSFKYENTLKYLKQMSKNPRDRVAEMQNRLRYQYIFRSNVSRYNPRSEDIQLSGEHNEGPDLSLNWVQYKTLRMGTSKFDLNPPNDHVITEENIVVKIRNIFGKENGAVYILASRYHSQESIFHIPMQSPSPPFTSGKLGLFKLDRLEHDAGLFKLDEIHAKCVVHEIPKLRDEPVPHIKYCYPMLTL